MPNLLKGLNGLTFPPTGINKPVLALGSDNGMQENSLLLWVGGDVASSILQVIPGNAGLSSPNNSWSGGIGAISSWGFVGGSVMDYRCFTTIEYGHAGDTPLVDNTGVKGRIQLGCSSGNVNPPSEDYRKGFVVRWDRTYNTDGLPFYAYNSGIPYTFNNSTPDNFERGKLGWNNNTLEIGAESGGTGIQRYLRLLGLGVKIPSILDFTEIPSGNPIFNANAAAPSPPIDFSIPSSGSIKISVAGVPRYIPYWG